MPGISIQLDKHSLQSLQTKLDTLAHIEDNLKPALSEIGEYLVSETKQRFKDSVSPDGESWREVKRGGKPLVDDGHLRDDVDYYASNDSVEIGTNLIYAAIHQLGGSAGRNGSTHIHPRPFLGINISDEREIGNILEQHISRSLNA